MKFSCINLKIADVTLSFIERKFVTLNCINIVILPEIIYIIYSDYNEKQQIKQCTKIMIYTMHKDNDFTLAIKIEL